MYDAFLRMNLKFAESDANFIWVDVQRESRDIFQKLLSRGVIVRAGSDISGGKSFIRVTIGTQEENRLFLDALEAALSA